MAIQELYNTLRIKKEYAKKDVVLRLPVEDLDTLLIALQSLGADVDKGYDNLLQFKNETNHQLELEEKEREVIVLNAYNSLRAKPISGKFKDCVGFISVNLLDKKPLLLTFPNGESQKYIPNKISVIEKDQKKLGERFDEIK